MSCERSGHQSEQQCRGMCVESLRAKVREAKKGVQANVSALILHENKGRMLNGIYEPGGQHELAVRYIQSGHILQESLKT